MSCTVTTFPPWAMNSMLLSTALLTRLVCSGYRRSHKRHRHLVSVSRRTGRESDEYNRGTAAVFMNMAAVLLSGDNMSRRIISHPPPREVIDEYAHQVCEQLAQTSNPVYRTPEVVWGSARF